MTTISINEILANNKDIDGSISGVNSRIKVDSQRRVYALWKRLSSNANEKCGEINEFVEQYSGLVKSEWWSDTEFLNELERLAHLLGYVTYLRIEKWFSSKSLKDNIHELTMLSFKFNHVFEKIIKVLATKSNTLAKQFLDKLAISRQKKSVL